MDQRDYTLLTETDLQRCTTGSVTICPAKIPLYHSSSNVRRELILPVLKYLHAVSQELAAPLPDHNFSTSRVEAGVPLPGTTPGHNT